MIDPLKLHAYLDGELNEAEAKELEAKLASCTASQAEVASIQSVKTVLKGRLETHQCEATWAACKSRIAEIERVDRSGNFISRYSWAFAMGVAAIVLVGGTLSRFSQQSSVSTGALAGFVGKSQVRTPQGQLKDALLTEALQRVDANLSKLRVLGGNELVVEGSPATQLFVEDSNGHMVLVIFNQPTNFEMLKPVEGTPFSAGSTGTGENVVAFQRRNQSILLIGNRSADALMTVAKKNF